MRHFFRDGRGMAVGQSCVRPLADEQVNMLSRSKFGTQTSYQDLSSRPIEESKSRLHDRLLLPLGRYRSDVLLIIFCVLFSVPDLLGTSAMAQSQHRAASRINFGDKAPLVSPAFGQEAKGLNPIRPLQVGDTIPEELWNMPLQVVNHPDGRDTITLNDYRDKKLIILDFWATWCAPCIATLLKLNKFQSRNTGTFALIPYSNEKIDILTKRMETLSLNFLTAYNKSSLIKFFPHRSITHQIWVRGGKIVHISNGEDATEENLMALINGNMPSLQPKFEILEFDHKEHLDRYAKETEIYQRSILTGPIKGIGSARRIFEDNGRKYLVLNNSRIIDAYKMVNKNPFARVLVDSAAFDDVKSLLNQRVNYQLIVNPDMTDLSCYSKLIKDIEDTFEIETEVDKAVLPVLVIKQNRSKNKKISSAHQYPLSLNAVLIQVNNSNIWSPSVPVYIHEADDIEIQSDFPIHILTSDRQLLEDVLENNGMSTVSSSSVFDVLKLQKLTDDQL